MWPVTINIPCLISFALLCFANPELVIDVTASNKMLITLHPMQQSASYARLLISCTILHFDWRRRITQLNPE
jgi:hypothetical protein